MLANSVGYVFGKPGGSGITVETVTLSHTRKTKRKTKNNKTFKVQLESACSPEKAYDNILKIPIEKIWHQASLKLNY